MSTTPVAPAVADIPVTPIAPAVSGRSRLVSGLPIQSVKVIVTYRTKDGDQEVVHNIDGADFQIVKCEHNVEEKVKQTRDPDTKQLMGYEPTGENLLTLKVKYVVPNP